MVVARILSTIGLFELIGDIYLRATGGSGRRFLFLLMALAAPICAFLPNAATASCLHPSSESRSHSKRTSSGRCADRDCEQRRWTAHAGGRSSEFLIGSSIGMSVGEYLQRVSFAAS
jgi:hypothetical protein